MLVGIVTVILETFLKSSHSSVVKADFHIGNLDSTGWNLHSSLVAPAQELFVKIAQSPTFGSSKLEVPCGVGWQCIGISACDIPAYWQQTAAVVDWLFEHIISRLTVVCSPWSTCCNVQPQNVYDAIADVAFDVVRRVSEVLSQALWWCYTCVHAPP